MPTIPYNRDITTQLAIGRPDGTTYEDVSDYLDYVEVELGNVNQLGTGNIGGDAVVRNLRFELRNDRNAVGDDSFHPLDKDSSFNQFDGSWNPLLWPLREVILRVAIQDGYNQESGTTQRIGENVGTCDGTSTTFALDYGPTLGASENVYADGTKLDKPSQYTIDYDSIPTTITTDVSGTITADYTYFKPLFAGYMGDSIQSDEGGTVVTCQCRDYAKLLQDTYIENVGEYGNESGVPAQNVIQQILDDYMGTEALTLYTPVDPGFDITDFYEVEYQSVWDAIQKIANQIGWFLGYLWDDDNLEWRLTLKKPPRDKSTGDYNITAQDDIYTRDLDINDSDIRNAVTVVYREGQNNERQRVTVEDQTSINEFRRRPMQLEEDNASLINTATEATNFATALLNDLKNLSSTTNITMPLFPDLDLFNSMDVNDPRLESEINFYAVESIRHTLDFNSNGSLRTEIVAGGRVIGSKTKWLRMETRPGAGKPVQFPEQATQAPPNKVKNFNVTQEDRGLLFTWKPITNEPVTYQIRRGNSWEDGQIVADDLKNDSYKTNQILKGANTYYIKAIDSYRNQSTEVAQSSVTVNFLPETTDVLFHNEFDNIDGIFNNVVDLSSGLGIKIGLKHQYTWENTTTAWEDLTEVTWASPVYVGEGTYETQPIDIGAIAKIYAITDITGSNQSGTGRTVEMAVSDDGVTYTDYELFNGGQYEGRYFKFRITFSSSGNYNNVDNFEIEFDAPEYTQKEAGVNVEVGGTTITFPEEFGIIPAIVCTTVGGGTARIISQSDTSFTVEVVDDSGTDVGGTINWSATGY